MHGLPGILSLIAPGEVAQQTVKDQAVIGFLFDEAEFNQTGERVFSLVAHVAIGRINAGGGNQQPRLMETGANHEAR
jgi:hypothetical protein